VGKGVPHEDCRGLRRGRSLTASHRAVLHARICSVFVCGFFIVVLRSLQSLDPLEITGKVSCDNYVSF
jgi:hypothetical protein